MSEYVSNGNSIIMVSSDMIELIGMSDRIVVFNNGSVSRENDSLKRNTASWHFGFW